MPEIAEVRLIADGVSKILVGNRIIRVSLTDPASNWSKKKVTGLDEFQSWLTSNKEGMVALKVNLVKTNGKFCWIELESGWKIMMQFGMSGNFRLEPTSSYLEFFNKNKGKRYTREEYLKSCLVKIDYEKADGSELDTIYYHDVRRFGSIVFTNNDAVFQKKIQKLGHDPLSEDRLSTEELLSRFRKHDRQNISVVLMNQEMVFAGVGNYIRSEILYTCRINPYSLVQDIPDSGLVLLYEAFREIAENAYKSGGSSLYTFTGIHGDKSDFKTILKVYGQTKDPYGNDVIYVSDKDAPAKRSLYWVPSIQSQTAELQLATRSLV